MRQWLYRKIVVPLLDLLRQGVTPEKLSLSIALGIVIGVFPMLGSTTLLCAAAAFALRLNLPAIQLVNYLIYPVQLILFLPFLEAGSRVVGARPIAMSLTQIFAMMKSDLWGLIKILWTASLGAMLVWLILAPITGAAIYFTLVPVLRGLRRTVVRE
jgi:uncharacterized protein (DUF2062 family)